MPAEAQLSAETLQLLHTLLLPGQASCTVSCCLPTQPVASAVFEMRMQRHCHVCAGIDTEAPAESPQRGAAAPHR